MYHFIHTSNLFFHKIECRVLAMGKKYLSVSVDLSSYSFLTFPKAYFIQRICSWIYFYLFFYFEFIKICFYLSASFFVLFKKYSIPFDHRVLMRHAGWLVAAFQACQLQLVDSAAAATLQRRDLVPHRG